MIRIEDISFANTGLFLEHAVGVAQHYGFVPMEQLPTHPEARVSGRAKKVPVEKLQLIRRNEKALPPVIHTCSIKGLGDARQPVFFWRLGPTIREGGNKFATFELHVMGVPSAVAEALLISVASTIADEAGIKERVVSINSLGNADSSARFVRDLGNYLRKHTHALTSQHRATLVRDPLAVFMDLIAREHELVERAPSSFEYLNEEERKHFWDMLEYLEMGGLPYELDQFVLGSRDCWNRSLFDVCRIENDRRVPFATGGRYDVLAGHCVGAGAAAASISIRCEVRGRATPNIKKTLPSSQVYFAHLGNEARRRSISVLELLRRANIPTYQSLAHERINEQMHEAALLKVPYIIIMGHKEATEGSVMIRDTRTNAQETVSLEHTPGYLKRRRIGV